MRSNFTSKPGFAIIVVLCCFFAAVKSVQAQQPQAFLSIQGVLTKSDGTAVEDNSYDLKFTLWKNQTGTSPNDKAWDETIPGVETIGGVYSVVLGNNGTNLTAPFDQVYYLGVSINGGQELTPRPLLTHSPYALSLIGQNNKFPSIGQVKVDWISAKSGTPGTGGYAFQSGGDEDGGLFSTGNGTVSLFTNNAERLKVESDLITVVPPLKASSTSNLIGEVTLGSDLNSNGNVFLNSSKGYCFNYNGTEYPTSGLFWYGGTNDGSVSLRGGGSGSGAASITVTGGDITFSGMDDGSGYDLQWDGNTGEVYRHSSSRRDKSNITPLIDDFSLILKSQPKRYTRHKSPDKWEIGYIAEEMDSIGLHNLVIYDNNGNNGKRVGGFDYKKMVLYITEVLKTQDAAIQELKSQNAAFQAEITALKSAGANTGAAASATQDSPQMEMERKLAEMSKRLQSLEATLSKR